MLVYLLAIVVAIGSFSFYMAAFFVPEMHRRQDFFWSGLGMFYAVVLWFCAGRLSGAVLLGQVASVVLLGGLGWHTLELRRSLTPEPVKTPVTWADLQAWVQGLQRQVGQYVPLGAIASRLQSVGQGVQRSLASVRDRLPASQDSGTASEVPPLKRSPAYEFETASGDGQAVPSEFATVAKRQAPSARSVAETESAEAAAAAIADATTEEPVSPSTTEAADEDQQNLAESPTVDANSGDSQLSSPARQQPAAKPQDATTTAQPAPTPADPKSVPTSAKPSARNNPLAGVVSWLGNAFKGQRKPKPQRGVVEIPPRSPSIPRGDTAPSTPAATPSQRSASEKNRPAKSSRAVIDIPPRPPSIPRSPASPTPHPPADQPTPSADQPKADTNRGDVGDAAAATGTNQAAPNRTEPATDQSEPPTPPVPETNWSDDDANWSDESASTRQQASTPPSTANETNWPDDDDTNWPD